MRKVWQVIATVALGVVLAGCSGGSGLPAAGEAPAPAQEGALTDDTIKVDQISYAAKPGVEGARRRVQFSYTNNSDYTIVGVRLDMALRDDVEDEEIESAFGELIENGLLNVDNIREWGMTCENTFAVEPGQESSRRTPLVGITYVTDMAQYELMEPDLLTIQFLVDGTIYEEYYDFRSESYTLSSDAIDATQWGSGELSEAIPRPEDALVTSTDEGEDRFSFDVSCMTADEFDDYVELVREAGYTVGVAQTDTTYYADSEDGLHHIDLMYWEESGALDGYLDAIEAE